MKISLITLVFCCLGFYGYSAVNVTPASGGTNICSTVATSPTTLGPITITEGLMTDFNTPSGSIVLAPPPGWTFVVSLPTTTAAPGGDVSIGVVSISAGSLSINFNVPTITHIDVITISNLQIQATSSLSASGNIIASSDFGVVGITTGVGGTNFGTLSIQAASVPSVTIAASPSGAICSGTPVTFTPTPVNGGTSPSYQWFVNGSFVGGGSFFSTSTLANGNTVNAIMTSVGGVCVAPPTANSNTITATVNPLPNPVVVSGGGTFCGSAVLTAANGGSGSIFFQGTTSGGTSTVLGSTPQTVVSSGTYYFRAQSGAGCWGVEGSQAVTINAAATANAGLPQSVCAGGTITLAGSIGGGATTSTWSAPSGTFSNVNSLTSTYTPTILSGTVTLTLTTNDPDGAGPCTPAISTVVITVNPVPNAVSVSGAGTFCGSTSISASLVGPGTIFFQGTTSGGTSTLLGGTPQIVNSSGTYYFRAQGAGGCWGVEGSTAVTINPAATANAGLPQSVCAGGTITLAGSIGGSATTSTWSAPSGAFSNVNSLTSTYTPSIGTGTVTLTLTTNDPDGAGPCAAAVSTVVITVNALPNTPFVFPVAPACGTASVSAFLAGPGTLYFQGTTSGGTSTALPGSPQTVNASGIYYYRAQSAAGCWGADANTTVTVNPLPTAYAVTGGGGYCAGGTGVVVGLANSDGGINYQLFRGVTALTILPGTGTSMNFGLQTTAGVYTVVATNPATGCTRNMTGSASVSINSLPTAFTLSGTGSYCSGGAGVTLTLSGSAVGVNYQLMLGGLPVGSPVAGTGIGTLNMGAQTLAGTYTCVATNTSTGCTANMLGSATVTVNPLPNPFSVVGGGGYCAGGTGVNISLVGSAAGVSYQLFRGITPVGSAVAGTGGILSFGLQTVAGTYTIVGTNTTTFCTNTMTGSATVTINPLPNLYTVTGGGSYCAGGAGVDIGLTGSDAGINYQLFNGVTPVGLAVAGTGFALDFGFQTAAGTYTVQATDATSLCQSNMTGSATVTVNAAPPLFTVNGGGGYCTGGAGVVVGLTGSTVGVNYQLYNLFAPVGAPVAGTGSAISFGLQTTAGFYTVTATMLATGCTADMTGGVAVTVLPLPTTYTMTGGGTICLGGSGVHVGLTGSDVGVNYQLYNGIVPMGSPVAGTGAALDFGLIAAAGTYTAVATDAFSGCSGPMTGSSTVTVNPLPNVYTVTGGGTICAGGAGVAIGLSGSDVGISYQLFLGASPVGSPVAGPTGPITFGLQTAAGTYTVVATNMATLCTNNMSGTAVINVNPAPNAYTVTVTGTGAYCIGGTGVDIALSSSDAGINYQLFRGITPVGAPVAGTGVGIDFGMQTVGGVYTVVGTNIITSCTGNMNNSVTVTVTPLPTVFTLSGSGTTCSSGPGVDLMLSGSQVGMSYQLYIGVTPVGSAVMGTGSALDMGFQTTAGTYTAVATDTAVGCTNNMTGTGTVIVNPAPTAYAVTGGGTYCTGGTGYHVGLANSDAGIDYQLYNGVTAVGSPLAGSGSSLDFGLFSVPGTYTVVATNTSTTCTAIMTGSAVIAVSPYPVVAAITGATTFCQGSTVTLSDDSTGGVWASGNLAIATVGSSTGVVTGVAGGTVPISYTVTNVGGCSTTVTKSETVLSAPTVPPINGYSTVCIGLQITLTDATGGGTWSSSNPAVATISPAGIVTGVSLGSVTITYTVPGVSCTTRVTKPVTVGDALPPSALLPTGSATLCHGTPVDLSVVTGSGAFTYEWYIDGTLIPGAVTSTYTATTPGLYTAGLSNGSCTEYFTGTNVLASPNAVISLDTPAGLLFTGSFVTYQWFHNGSLVAGATTNNIPVGTLGDSYFVVVTDANGCTDTSALFIYGGGTLQIKPTVASKDIRIYPNPATSVLYIDAPAKVFVSVVSPDGSVLIEKREAVSLNVGSLANGMYMIMIYDENSQLLKTDKFVKMQ